MTHLRSTKSLARNIAIEFEQHQITHLPEVGDNWYVIVDGQASDNYA
jgi:hypothetical protein